MKISRLHIVAVLAVTAIIALVAIVSSRVRVSVKPVPVPLAANPLKIALEYGSTDERFEELVKKYPEWISHRSDIPGSFNAPILAGCALLMKTNYARILIANGADVEDAVKSLMEVSATDATNLLRQIQTERPR